MQGVCPTPPFLIGIALGIAGLLQIAEDRSGLFRGAGRVQAVGIGGPIFKIVESIVVLQSLLEEPFGCCRVVVGFHGQKSFSGHGAGRKSGRQEILFQQPVEQAGGFSVLFQADLAERHLVQGRIGQRRHIGAQAQVPGTVGIDKTLVVEIGTIVSLAQGIQALGQLRSLSQPFSRFHRLGKGDDGGVEAPFGRSRFSLRERFADASGRAFPPAPAGRKQADKQE